MGTYVVEGIDISTAEDIPVILILKDMVRPISGYGLASSNSNSWVIHSRFWPERPARGNNHKEVIAFFPVK